MKNFINGGTKFPFAYFILQVSFAGPFWPELEKRVHLPAVITHLKEHVSICITEMEILKLPIYFCPWDHLFPPNYPWKGIVFPSPCPLEGKAKGLYCVGRCSSLRLELWSRDSHIKLTWNYILLTLFSCLADPHEDHASCHVQTAYWTGNTNIHLKEGEGPCITHQADS